MSTEISIIIPAYNRAQLIRNTLDSLLKQDFENWECLVIDDFSKDDTQEIIRIYEKLDNRIRYYLNERTKGAQGARNSGILKARAKWIVFFDSDNEMKSTFLFSMFNKVLADNCDVCTCFSQILDRFTGNLKGSFNWITSGYVLYDLLTGITYIDYNAAIINKDKLFEIGLLDEKCPSFQEWDTHLRLSKTCRYTTIPEYFVKYYVGGQDTISIDGKRSIEGLLYILKKHKSLWKGRYYNRYLHYGSDVLSRIKSIDDFSYRLNKKILLYKLMPVLLFKNLKTNVYRVAKYVKHRILKFH